MERFTTTSLEARLTALPAHAVYAQLTGREDWGAKMQELVPEHIRIGIVRYIAYGSCTGHFLRAVFKSDLFGAYRRADATNLAAIGDIVSFLYNYAPGQCAGSEARFLRWQDLGGMIGQQQKAGAEA